MIVHHTCEGCGKKVRVRKDGTLASHFASSPISNSHWTDKHHPRYRYPCMRSGLPAADNTKPLEVPANA